MHVFFLNNFSLDIALTPVLEGFVICKKNPEYDPEDTHWRSTTRVLNTVKKHCYHVLVASNDQFCTQLFWKVLSVEFVKRKKKKYRKKCLVTFIPRSAVVCKDALIHKFLLLVEFAPSGFTAGVFLRHGDSC